MKYVKSPKTANRVVRIYSEDEYGRLIKAAEQSGGEIRWDLLILVALCTGMRRGEPLNTTWSDIDFENLTITVSPKPDNEETWQWYIKDNERRRLPLTEEIVNLLAEHQSHQPEGHPYVFVPPARYADIQRRRQKGTWTVQHGCCPINNFTDRFKTILKRAGIRQGTFHDLRRTALSNWLYNDLNEYDVMNLAGHSCFEITHSFYLATRKDILQRA